MKRLYRSTTDRMLGGICGGLAEYWNVDPTLIRLAVTFFILVTGFFPGVLAYILGLIIIPERQHVWRNR